MKLSPMEWSCPLEGDKRPPTLNATNKSFIVIRWSAPASLECGGLLLVYRQCLFIRLSFTCKMSSLHFNGESSPFSLVLATWVICSQNRRLQHDLTSGKHPRKPTHNVRKNRKDAKECRSWHEHSLEGGRTGLPTLLHWNSAHLCQAIVIDPQLLA